jgi:hypothetical protein
VLLQRQPGTTRPRFSPIEHATRRFPGATPHPVAPWIAQATTNLMTDLQDAGCQARVLIRDHDGK